MKTALLTICASFLFAACGLGPDISKDRVPRSPSPTPFVPERPIAEYLSDGNVAYGAGKFPEAIESYKRAFEIEQREQKLDAKQRRELVANLAMSYMRTGQVDNGKLTIAYGVAKDYNYPTYHYALACGYAVDGDEGSSLARLRTAYSFRNNLPAGESLPDPLSDSCFESVSSSDTFKKAFAEIKTSKARPKAKASP